jgi:hypothetical protein
MSTGGLSKARLGRMREVMAGHVKAGAVPGLVTLSISISGPRFTRRSTTEAPHCKLM